MTPETRATLERLAAMECPCFLGKSDWICCGGRSVKFAKRPCLEHCNCQGTGRRFSRLVERCRAYPDLLGNGRHYPHCRCGGTGYVLAEHDLLERVETCLTDMGWSVTARKVLDGKYRIFWHSDERIGESGIAYGPTLLDADAAALEAAVQRETVTPEHLSAGS